MQICLRRHALTAHNLEKRYSGRRSDPPLCPEGRAQAARLADDRVQLVYTSQLQRTQETARLLYPAADILPVADFAEMDFGLFEGQNWQELQHEAAYQNWLDGNCLGLCPDGEDWPGFSRRVTQAFLQIARQAQAAEPGGAETLHFVLHGGTLMAICARFAEPAQEPFAWPAAPCGGYRARLVWQDDMPCLRDISKL